MEQEFDEQDVRTFYRILRHKERGLTELRLIDPRRRSKPVIGFFDSEEAFIYECRKWSGKRNVYAGRNPRP